MIQDIAPHKLDNQYHETEARPGDVILVFEKRQTLVKTGEDGSISLLRRADWEAAMYETRVRTPADYLFSIDHQQYFLVFLPEEVEAILLERGWHWMPMFSTRGLKQKVEVMALATGWHLSEWYRVNRYCGACGKPMKHDKKERMMRCPVCGNMVFPRLCPAVIVGVTNGNKLLMTKYAGREYTRYALIAGFTEIGETVEETVAREVMEEVGLAVKNIRYYKSQPWGYDQDILMGYYCDLDGEDRIRLDDNELAVAEWVDWHDIEEDVEKLSLTREMMEHFRDCEGHV